MKSARERAEDLWRVMPMGVAALLDRTGWVVELERVFKEHARDQRQRCGSALLLHPMHTLRRNAARNVVLNAPEPGEEP